MNTFRVDRWRHMQEIQISTPISAPNQTESHDFTRVSFSSENKDVNRDPPISEIKLPNTVVILLCQLITTQIFSVNQKKIMHNRRDHKNVSTFIL